MDEIRQAYIVQALTEYMKSVTATMDAVIGKRANTTGELKNSIASQVQKINSAGGTSELKFKEYGRFIDMGVGRGHKMGANAAHRDTITLATNGQKRNNKGIRPPVKIYSKIAYGKLNGLMQDLLYGLTDETIEKIKTELENGSTINN